MKIQPKVIVESDFQLTIPDLILPAGAVVFITGSSGAGKSTFLRYLCGLTLPRFSEHAHFTMMFQDHGLLPFLKVHQNISLACDSSVLPEQVLSVMRELEIDHLWNRNINQISGGESARVALARLMLSRRPYVCLDEPFRSLDGKLAFELASLCIERLRSRNKTVLIVSHDPWDVFCYGDYWMNVEKGMVSEVRKVEDLISQGMFSEFGVYPPPGSQIELQTKYTRKFSNGQKLTFGLSESKQPHRICIWE